MGGPNSGRRPDPAKQFRKPQTEQRVPISNEMFLPNVSNVQDFARKDRPDSKFTVGSVLFADTNGVVSQDNTNFFWDDTNNRLGIGTNTPSHNLDVHGHIEVEHTANETFDHAVEIHLDAGGFGGSTALTLFFDTGAVAGGKDETVNLVSIDQSDATGGDISGFKVLSTGGSANVTGLSVAAQVAPISQQSGGFGDMDSALVKAVDRKTEFLNAGNDIAMFVADDDTITIGDAAKYTSIEFLLATVASGAGIKPKFEFSTGTDAWTEFFPTDGTGGMHNNGVVAWELDDISGWAVGTGTEFLIRITRQRNNLTTVPIESKVQITVGTSEFSWDKSGDIIANKVTANLVPNAEMDAGAHTIGFTQQSATGDGTTTIDWKLGNKFFFTMGAFNETFTFTAPTNPCSLTLVVKQDSVGSRTATWPSAVKWPGGTAPTLTTGANLIDIVGIYFDGTNYYSVASLDMK